MNTNHSICLIAGAMFGFDVWFRTVYDGKNTFFMTEMMKGRKERS